MIAAKLTEAELAHVNAEREQRLAEWDMLHEQADAFDPITDMGYIVVLWVTSCLLVAVSVAVIAGWL